MNADDMKITSAPSNDEYYQQERQERLNHSLQNIATQSIVVEEHTKDKDETRLNREIEVLELFKNGLIRVYFRLPYIKTYIEWQSKAFSDPVVIAEDVANLVIYADFDHIDEATETYLWTVFDKDFFDKLYSSYIDCPEKAEKPLTNKEKEHFIYFLDNIFKPSFLDILHNMRNNNYRPLETILKEENQTFNRWRYNKHDKEAYELYCKLTIEIERPRRDLHELMQHYAKSCNFKGKLPNTPTIYDVLPNDYPVMYMYTVLNYHSKNRNMPTTKNGTRKNNRHQEIKYAPAKGGYTITQTNTAGEQIEVTFENVEKINGKGVKKCLTFLLATSNKQNFKPVIGFSLQELVDRGMYSSLVSARAGIKSALDTLQSIKIRGAIKKGKRKTIKQEEAGVLFYHYKIKNNYVEVSVNENFNIEFIASCYALFPQFAYKLNDSNAFDLCYYIFSLARQNTDNIKKSGSFNVSFISIREYLALPYEDEYKTTGSKWKPKQYVIDPILSAINDIQTGANAANCTDFTITPIYNQDYSNLDEFLEGYVKVEVSGELCSKLITIEDTKEKKIAQAIEKGNKKKQAALTKQTAQAAEPLTTTVDSQENHAPDNPTQEEPDPDQLCLL